MAMAHALHQWTIDDLDALPDDGNRYELIDGDLYVSPAPGSPHQEVAWRLAFALGKYLEPLGMLDAVKISPSRLSWGRTDTAVDPDIWISAPDEMRLRTWSHTRVPLVVEVVSPSSRRRDYHVKRDLFQRQGVGLYWIIDPRHRAASESRNGAELQQVEVLRWQVTADAPEFAVDVRSLLDGLSLTGEE